MIPFWRNRYLLLALRLIIGGLFIYASLDKIAHPEAFAQAISNYKITPYWGINMIALVLPWVEFVAGLTLILGLWVRGSSLLLTAMILVFIGAMAQASLRGIDTHCGCFSVDTTGEKVGLLSVLRDVAMLVACVMILAFDKLPLGLGRKSS
jgi:uncharacterized membrane protein YphA (DoxX/SURF4 family)